MPDTPVTITDKQKFWISRIERSRKRESAWRNEGRAITAIYRDDGHLHHRGNDSGSNHGRDPVRPFEHHHNSPKFNILWSNTEILKPATLSALPEPDVRRRFNVENPIALGASEILEKSLSFMADDEGFIEEFKQARDDFLLPGRGVLRVRYSADIRRFELERVIQKTIDESGNEIESELFKRGDEFLMPDGFEVEGELVDIDVDGANPFIEMKVSERVFPEYVFWEDFLMSDHRNWSDVVKEGWIAFRHEFDKFQMRQVFGRDVATKIKTPEMKEPDGGDTGSIVWEIWDAVGRKVVWMAMDGIDVLDEVDDPLDLKNFYPVPKPLYPFETTDTLEPVPLFRIYEGQAHELNTVETRLHRLTRALKATGVYNGANSDDIANLASGEDGTLIPVKSIADFTGGTGTLEGQIAWMPIDQIARTIGELRLRKAELKQEIFELTGISDLIRGASDPRETARAAGIKGSFGALRMRPLREPVEQMFRDFYRLAGELMAEKFDEATFVKITGAEVDPAVMQLLKSDQLREFRIDIETDSTVQPNEEFQRGQATEFAGVMNSLLNGTSEFLSSQPLPMQAIMAPVLFETMKATVRQFKVGRSVEDELNTALEQVQQFIQQQLDQPPPEPAPPDPIEAGKLQLAAAKLQSDSRDSQLREQNISQGQQLDMQNKRERNQTDIIKNLLDVSAAGEPLPRIG